MAPVPVTIEPPEAAPVEVEELVFFDDLDSITDNDINMGCGDDNPYR